MEEASSPAKDPSWLLDDQNRLDNEKAAAMVEWSNNRDHSYEGLLKEQVVYWKNLYLEGIDQKKLLQFRLDNAKDDQERSKGTIVDLKSEIQRLKLVEAKVKEKDARIESVEREISRLRTLLSGSEVTASGSEAASEHSERTKASEGATTGTAGRSVEPMVPVVASTTKTPRSSTHHDTSKPLSPRTSVASSAPSTSQ